MSLSFLLLALSLLVLVLADCEDSTCSAFKTYKLPLQTTFPTSASEGASLDLVAAGMRRKNLLVLEVDVYTVGIYLAKFTTLFAGDSLASQLSEAGVGILLHFVRQVGKGQMVDALVEAMSGEGAEYNTALSAFSALLDAAVDAKGMKKDGEIMFTFLGEGGEGEGVVL
ncbi:hypothetical protein B484DRAFT_442052, partial [Ochromonadaceae sp. CCMP2298]